MLKLTNQYNYSYIIYGLWRKFLPQQNEQLDTQESILIQDVSQLPPETDHFPGSEQTNNASGISPIEAELPQEPLVLSRMNQAWRYRPQFS